MRYLVSMSFKKSFFAKVCSFSPIRLLYWLNCVRGQSAPQHEHASFDGYKSLTSSTTIWSSFNHLGFSAYRSASNSSNCISSESFLTGLALLETMAVRGLSTGQTLSMKLLAFVIISTFSSFMSCNKVVCSLHN